jgi:hypothetical protein
MGNGAGENYIADQNQDSNFKNWFLNCFNTMHKILLLLYEFLYVTYLAKFCEESDQNCKIS